ncbi:hypothetical protein L2E82_45185 [Cichorium intybus]|uniref:Uncharacterized protein n=1 Tax=Cichorium intybus TaxID=13427 RepID=A0ACB8ZRB9_CICIN|nr:hypothetical protein L2E82_45185 [Cichorium intybus]
MVPPPSSPALFHVSGDTSARRHSLLRSRNSHMAHTVTLQPRRRPPYPTYSFVPAVVGATIFSGRTFYDSRKAISIHTFKFGFRYGTIIPGIAYTNLDSQVRLPPSPLEMHQQTTLL